MNCILQSLIYHSTHSPDSIAFVDDSCEITYEQLLLQVREAAEQLLELKPQCIAFRAENSVDWVIIDLAAMYAGIPIVPVPMFFTQQQVDHTLTESGADVLIGDWQQWHPVSIGELERLRVWKLPCPSTQELLPKTGKVTFTSGSTGQPKGVCLSSEQIAKISRILADTIATDVSCDKHMVLLPLSTLLENITGIYVPLLLGTTSVVLCGKSVGLMGSSQFNASKFALALAQHQPTTIVLTPALLMALIGVAKSMPVVTEKLKFVAIGGARVSPQLIELAHQLNIPAYEGYGLSENASVVSLNTPSAHKAGTSGKPLSHVKVKIANDGEIWVSGNSALGYVNEPFDQEWLATGDLGHLDDDGFLVISGRKKNQIITAFGRNISPEWVESEAQAFPDLLGMVVLGEGDKTLTAVLDNQDIESVTESLRKLNAILPDYAHIGRVIVAPELRTLSGLYTSNGRPIRAQFEERFGNRNQSESCTITTKFIE